MNRLVFHAQAAEDTARLRVEQLDAPFLVAHDHPGGGVIQDRAQLLALLADRLVQLRLANGDRGLRRQQHQRFLCFDGIGFSHVERHHLQHAQHPVAVAQRHAEQRRARRQDARHLRHGVLPLGVIAHDHRLARQHDHARHTLPRRIPEAQRHVGLPDHGADAQAAVRLDQRYRSGLPAHQPHRLRDDACQHAVHGQVLGDQPRDLADGLLALLGAVEPEGQSQVAHSSRHLGRE